MEELRTLIPGANITLPAERAHCDSVLVQDGQVVRKGAIHVANSAESGRQYARESGNKAGAQQRLENLFP